MRNTKMIIAFIAFWLLPYASFSPITLKTPIVLGEINKIDMAQTANEYKVSAAVDASKKWLALVDSKQYKNTC